MEVVKRDRCSDICHTSSHMMSIQPRPLGTKLLNQQNLNSSLWGHHQARTKDGSAAFWRDKTEGEILYLDMRIQQ